MILTEEEYQPKFQLKLKKSFRRDGSVYEILLYCEPNSGHGYTPIAKFCYEFVDAEQNAEWIVKLWNDKLKGGLKTEPDADMYEALKELIQAMHDYEMDVEGDAPQSHIDMMTKARQALTKAGYRRGK